MIASSSPERKPIEITLTTRSPRAFEGDHLARLGLYHPLSPNNLGTE